MTLIDFYETKGIGNYLPKWVLDWFFKEKVKIGTVSVKNDNGQVICAANVKTVRHQLSLERIAKKIFSKVRIKTEKDYRLDLNLWETKYTAFNFLSFYKCLINEQNFISHI